MPFSRQSLGHGVGELEVGGDGHDLELAHLDPVLDVVIVDIYMFCPIWLRLSAGPFFAPTVIFK